MALPVSVRSTIALKVLTTALVALAPFCFQTEAQSVRFPSAPSIDGNGMPLVIQLACTTNCLNYRSPAEIYARFVNRGKELIELPLDSIPWGGIESKLKWTVLGNNGKRSVSPWKTGLKSPHLMLMPHESVTIKLYDRLFPPGTNRISVKYTLGGETVADTNRIQVESDTIELVVLETPISDEERKVLNREYEEATQYMYSCAYESDEWLRSIVKKKFLVGSPYSVPYLTNQLLTARSPTVRSHMAELLGDIASREKSTEFGFHRDTSAIASVLGQLEKEEDPQAKQALLQAVFWFSDAMDVQQKDKLQITIAQLLDHGDADVRFWAAFDCLRMFPEHRQIVKNRLAMSGFVRETYRPILVQTIRTEDAKSEKAPAKETAGSGVIQKAPIKIGSD